MSLCLSRSIPFQFAAAAVDAIKTQAWSRSVEGGATAWGLWGYRCTKSMRPLRASDRIRRRYSIGRLAPCDGSSLVPSGHYKAAAAIQTYCYYALVLSSGTAG